MILFFADFHFHNKILLTNHQKSWTVLAILIMIYNVYMYY